MKVLTIKEPWASLVVDNVKRIENRSWKTNYRGALAIHAGVSQTYFRVDVVAWEERYGVRMPQPGDVTFGAIIGVIDLVDCVHVDELEKKYPELAGHAFAEGPYAWVLTNARRIDPIACNGKLGLWDANVNEPQPA